MTTNDQATSRAVNEGVGCSIEYAQNPTLQVNGNVVHPPRYAGLKNKPHTAFAVDITKWLHKRPGEGNKVIFSWQNSLKRFVAVLELVKTVPLPDIVQRIRQTKTKSKTQVLADRNAHHYDDDVAVDAEVISLKDPVSKLRITTPGRPSTCQHTQCFDLLTFFQLTELAPNFTCPVCNRAFEAGNLIVDGWFDELLQNTRQEDQTAEVDPQTMEWKVTGVASDDEDEEGEEIKRELARQESAKKSDAVICLDDSDDESRPPRPSMQSQPQVQINLPVQSTSHSQPARMSFSEGPFVDPRQLLLKTPPVPSPTLATPRHLEIIELSDDD
jgi:hypothetical protein